MTRRVVLSVVGLVAVAAAWLTLAPEQLGGPVTYVITKGNSMEPGIREGDLVLVREADRYGVGDVVAYRNSQLDSVVVHRIVGATDEGFTIQGDNNTWTDSVTPTADDMVGKPWVRIPKAGRVVTALSEPRTAAVLAGVGVLVAAAGGTVGTRRRRRRRRSEATRPDPPAPAGIRPPSGWQGRAVVACAALTAASAAVATWAGFAPRETSEPRQADLVQQGEFSYSAPAADRTVYPRGEVTTGMPVFLKLVDSLDVRFRYRLEGPEGDYDGTARLDAVVQDEAGWRRSFPVGGPERFSGTTANVGGRLDFRRLRRILSDVQHATGVVRTEYQLMLSPRVDVTGTARGVPLQRSFSPVLRLRFQEELVTPLDDLDGQKDPLRPAQRTSVYVPGRTANHVEVGGTRLPVRTMQVAAVGATAFFAVLLAALWVAQARRRGVDEPTHIERHYGRWLVAARALPQGSPVVLESFDAVVSLAEQHEQLILHAHDGVRHRYGVHLDGVTYVYAVPPEPASAPSTTPGTEPAPHVQRVVAEVFED